MPPRNSILNTINISKPCRVGWDEMAGDHQLRPAANVTKTSTISRKCREARLSIWWRPHTATCAFGSPGGLMVWWNPGSAVSRRSIKQTAFAGGGGGVVTAMLGIGMSSGGGSPRRIESASVSQPAATDTPATQQTTQNGGAAASLRGTVNGDDGLPIQGARVAAAPRNHPSAMNPNLLPYKLARAYMPAKKRSTNWSNCSGCFIFIMWPESFITS